MIKFFRKIRYDLMGTNKTGKYFKYAIGEIVLVVIGILIALSLNNWNELQNVSKKELSLLNNLKNEINTDIINLKKEDSTYAILEKEAALGLKLFYKAKTVKEIYSVYSLIRSKWRELSINSKTYNEMLNSGSMYTMTNYKLQNKIGAYYLAVETDKNYIKALNSELGYLWNITPELTPFKFLMSQVKNPKTNFDLIDTTWVNNPNSETYLALDNFLNLNQGDNNRYRRRVFKRNIELAEKLLAAINEELELRKK